MTAFNKVQETKRKTRQLGPSEKLLQWEEPVAPLPTVGFADAPCPGRPGWGTESLDLHSRHRVRWCPAAFCYLLGADVELWPQLCCCSLVSPAATADTAAAPEQGVLGPLPVHREAGVAGGSGSSSKKSISLSHTHILSLISPPCFFHFFFF